MTRWFRFYDDVINDPKVMRLSEAMRWHWVAVLCCASKNDGVVPSASDLAFHLRMKASQVGVILAELFAGSLLDKREDGNFVPHNWDGRQYKSDVSTERVKRFRKQQRNVSSAVSETPPEQKQNRTDDDADDAHARPSTGNLTTPEAMQLSEKLLVIAGHDPSFWPPGWCGAPLTVQKWLNNGWAPEIIVAAVTGAAARKRGQPANSVQFFEKAIAEEVARQAAPLPNVEIKPAQTLVVTHGTSLPGRSGSSITAELRRELAQLEGPESPDHQVPNSPVLLVSN